MIWNTDTLAPYVTYTLNGEEVRVVLGDYVVGADGYRRAEPQGDPGGCAEPEYEKVYPFGWLGAHEPHQAGEPGTDLCQA
ncbi:hypothetical protein OKA06_18860 [Novosphingobium sp. MW5]|nr:hypothetical protein [Novosphingobium sp. MW5]